MRMTSFCVLALVAFLCSCGKETEPGSDPQDYAAGRRAFDSKDYEKAYKIWLPLANQGDAGAQFFIGFLSETGQGVKQDMTEAAKWYLLSADQNMGDAQARVSRLLALGQGTPSDKIQAYKWAELSSELGNAQARQELSELKAGMKEAEIKEAIRLVQEWKDKRPRPTTK